MKLWAVGDAFFVGTFQLMGAGGTVVQSPDEARREIERLLADDEIGVVLVAQTLADRIGEAFSAYIERRDLPLVLAVPDRESSAKGVEQVMRVLQASLGITF
ncbi:MAG: hypothetical protein DRP95_00015 [Candidatus Latescibacterota bacterium]|nr:MAG: hypothetical protein DRP95_00015 [Candidatus Latescibacterota bacterium]